MKLLRLVKIVLVVAAFMAIGSAYAHEIPDSKSAMKNVFNPKIDGKWIGLGISYGPYRDGESPDKNSVTSEAHILEDFDILINNPVHSWHLIRMYGADAASEQVLRVIKKHQLPVRVMLGAWLSGKDPMEENLTQLENVVRLANEYKDIVVAVNLGNEIFVDWSWHKFEVDQIPMYLEWVDDVKAKVDVPVTLADDYNFWNKPWSQQVAERLDFIVLHAYAIWNSQPLEVAVEWTANVYHDIAERHPSKQIALGEAGWATSSISSNGDERLIIAEASEEAQETFFTAYHAWLKENNLVSFYFEAFDEKWKGGEDKPEGVAEKNWGLYRSDRTPKKVVSDQRFQ